jgi:elongation factor 1-gamma
MEGKAIQIAASLAGMDVKVETVKSVHKESIANKGPVLQTESGSVFGVGACLRYIARSAPSSGLYGATFFDAAAVDQWMDFASTSVEPHRAAWMTPIITNKPTEASVVKAAKSGVSGALRAFNLHLNSNTFLVGHQATIADILAFVTFAEMFARVLPEQQLSKQAPNFVRYFQTLAHDPSFAAVCGEIEQCDTEEKAPVAAKKEEVKAAPKAAAKKEVEEVFEEEKPKAPNPLTLLPPSRMNMDAEKKRFFNDPNTPFNANFFTEGNFWDEIYDPEGYSCYTCLYNYNDENEVFWQTQNLLGGYIQRLDPARKFAFGAMILSGKDEETKPWIIHGVWIFRGTSIPFEVSDCPQSEYYTFTKVDVSTPEGRAVVQERFQSDKVLDGQAVLDRRYFK